MLTTHFYEKKIILTTLLSKYYIITNKQFS